MVGILGDGGTTRLTWLVNTDVGGLVPSSFTTAFLVSVMAYPFSAVHYAKAMSDVSKVPKDDVLGLESGLDSVSRETFAKMQSKLERAEKRTKLLEGELDAFFEKAEKAEKRAEMLQGQLQTSIKKGQKAEAELSELRRRLKRVDAEENEDN